MAPSTPLPDNVVLLRPEEDGAWGQGPAVCLECRHRWVQVARIGYRYFDCPKCKIPKGTYTHTVAPRATQTWTCNCGGDVFYVLPQGIECVLCGHIADKF